MSLWLSAREVPPGPIELVAALVNHTGVEATFGVAATVDRWEDGSWVAHRQLVMCMDHWHCTAEMKAPGEGLAVEAIGLSATLDRVGPVERFTTDGLGVGWYRISQEANEGIVASGVIEVAEDAAPPAPLAPVDDPSISVSPPVVAPSSAATVDLSPLIPAPSGSQSIGDVEDAVDGLAETAAVQRWDGADWEPVTDVELLPTGSQGSALHRSADLPVLREGEYRLVRSGPHGDHVGRFWAASTSLSSASQTAEPPADGDEGTSADAAPAGWTPVRYEEVTFSVPPGWVEQEWSNCDLRTNVKGYYLRPPRQFPPEGGMGCATHAEHWDTRDTITLVLLPDELVPDPPPEGDPFATDAGLQGVRWENGERLVQYYFPGPRLAVSAYHSLAPQVHPEDVVRTISTTPRPSSDDGGEIEERVAVTLYHCGIYPLDHAGQRWEVPIGEQPFDATNAPATFVGAGTVERLPTGELAYTDDSGIQLRFVPDDDVDPQPCD